MVMPPLNAIQFVFLYKLIGIIFYKFEKGFDMFLLID